MAPKYTHHYWDCSGRGEPIRLAFHYAGAKFTDTRYQFGDVSKIKGDERLFPLGQLPTLEVDDEVYCQSHAILRFLGNEFNMNGKTNNDKLRIDEILYTLQNMDEQLFGGYFWKPADQKEEAIKKIMAYGVHAYEMFENILKKNNNGKDFLVGKEVSIADIHLVCSIETLQLEENLSEYKNFIDGYPLVKALNERLRNLDKIKDFLEKRGPPNYKEHRNMLKAQS